MHRIKRLLLTALCIAVAFSGTLTANAAAHSLPPGFLIGDQDGINVTVDGRYFINVEGLKANDVITKTLVLRNTEKGSPYKITMTAEPLFSIGPADLLDKVHLELEMDGKVLYSGRVRGDEDKNMIYNALDLGKYNYGDSRVLNIKMTVDSDLKLGWTESVAEFRWHFRAVRDESEQPPSTGVYIRYGLYIVTCGMLTGISIILVLKKRKENKEYSIRQT